MTLRLGVNIDHVATLRNARGTRYPDPLEAAQIAMAHGADGITIHLREDRRHIRDADVRAIRQLPNTPLNLEMANTPEMLAIACDARPDMVTLVPERREELTTEGGLDVVRWQESLSATVTALQAAGITVSLFIEPTAKQVEAAHALQAGVVEFHTGQYCHWADNNEPTRAQEEIIRLKNAATLAHQLGLTVSAGHGLNRHNVAPVLTLPALHELNIGHSIIAHAVFVGLGPAIQAMKQACNLPVTEPTNARL